MVALKEWFYAAFYRDPAPIWPILDGMKTDPSLYVRKSVANSLNDISKDYAEWMLDKIAGWDLGHEHSVWIARHAARTLIKAGHPGSFTLLGFEREPLVEVGPLELSVEQLVVLGGVASFFFCPAVKEKDRTEVGGGLCRALCQKGRAYDG
ncbi:MAG: hypothetical protein ACI906_004248 [Candidatus Latescibacterota bacterium]|jgi:hypothetical protein